MKLFGLLAIAFPFVVALGAPNHAAASSCDPISMNNRCICTMHYDPVCGMDGKTYNNECRAACECVDVAYSGDCTKKCDFCDGSDYEPVCGTDGNTYGNDCYAKCLEVKVAYEGECGPVVSPNPRP